MESLHECESSDAQRRDGAVRSSEEASVMEVERRGCPKQLKLVSQLKEIRMTSSMRAKSIEISRQEVYEAWKRVKANQGAGGVDKESVAMFEAKLEKNLYKLWNRMSSGSYFPQSVRRVEIPKKDGSVRPLGIPTVYDRVAQEVVRARLEKDLEPLFHADSYGYRPGKSAIDALGVCRKRNWIYDWVIDVDIRKFFDTIDHELLMKAVNKHCKEKWMALYVERWLKSPIQHADGREEVSEQGTPQGGVISPLLANLYLHYTFDKWMERKYPAMKFERFADDMVIHCNSEAESKVLKGALEKRLADCGLSLNTDKTRIVYCKDSNRKGNYSDISYTFLGYTFRPRAARRKVDRKLFTSFLPAVSREAQKRLRTKLRDKRLQCCITLSIEGISDMLNPMLRGWLQYFSHFYPSALQYVCYHVDRHITRWVAMKYKLNIRRAAQWLVRLKRREPTLFAHWRAANISI
jgi:group II intron reverse transcriptase/maturase